MRAASIAFALILPGVAQAAGVLTGRVLGPDLVPVEGATVSLPGFGETEFLAQTTTDNEGMFHLNIETSAEKRMHRHSPPLIVEAQAQGYAATYVDSRHLTLFVGANKDLGDILLGHGRTYRGRIIDQSGNAVVGARVRCSGRRNIAGHTIVPIGNEILIRTDADGRFRTPPLPLGVPKLRAEGDGYAGRYYKQDEIRNPESDGTLPDVALEPDKPVRGIVRNERGEPIAGANVKVNGVPMKTDSNGHFVIRSFGQNSKLILVTSSDGYAPSRWLVTVKSDGLEYVDMGKTASKKSLDDDILQSQILEITLEREGQIFGRAIDADTGAPVTISRVVLCTFTRKENGEIVLNGCRIPRFSQPQPGRFVVPYSQPAEYHLLISAEGYHDAEIFTPPVSSLQRVSNTAVKMKSKDSLVEDEPEVPQEIVAEVKEFSPSLGPARVALWSPPTERNAYNSHIIRGRTTVGDGNVAISTTQMLDDSSFSMQVPYQSDNWYVLIETPRRVAAVHGPISVGKNHRASVAVDTMESGGLRGSVVNHSTVEVPLYAILFSDIGIQYEVPVSEDGSFEILNVYPGTYGLKVGSDGILDSEVPRAALASLSKEEREAVLALPSEPWKRAVRVVISENEVVAPIAVKFKP